MLRAIVQAWQATLAAVLRDTGVLLLLVGAPVLYGFFYPWPYAQQAVTRVPVAVVDLDHSSLSRQITRFAAANPRIDVRWVTGDLQQAQQALWRGEIEGFAVLPADLKRQVVRGSPATVTVEGDGAYALLNKAVLYGFAEAVGTVSAGVEIKKLQAAGQGARQATASRSPINTQMVPLFNPTEGYGSYVVPAVALLIIQQTLLMGAALLAGTWAETGAHRASARTWLGRILGLSTLGLLSGLFYVGWVFEWQDFPRGGNPWGAVALLALYAPAISALGLLLGVWFRDRERAMQVLHAAVGSATVAMMGATAIVSPIMVHYPNISPEIMTLAIGSGAIGCTMVTDSLFWLVKQYCGATLNETLKYYTSATFVASLMALAGTFLLSYIV